MRGLIDKGYSKESAVNGIIEKFQGDAAGMIQAAKIAGVYELLMSRYR